MLHIKVRCFLDVTQSKWQNHLLTALICACMHLKLMNFGWLLSLWRPHTATTFADRGTPFGLLANGPQQRYWTADDCLCWAELPSLIWIGKKEWCRHYSYFASLLSRVRIVGWKKMVASLMGWYATCGKICWVERVWVTCGEVNGIYESLKVRVNNME